MSERSILITTSSFGREDSRCLNTLEDVGYEIIFNPLKRRLIEAEVGELIIKHQPIGMIAGVEPLTLKVLKMAKNLKVISRCGIGLDSVDLKAAANLRIAVMNTPDAPTIPVAELTLGMILALLRRVHIIDAGIRRGEWERPMGLLLHGKTVGIVGCGRIGSYLARLLSNFGCRVLGFDPYLDQHEFCHMVTLDALLAQSDIVSLHIPYSRENHHFIAAEQLTMMKKGAILINAARGGLIDEKALFTSLQGGHLWGAALDCYEDEPYKGELRMLPNVLLTSHIGSYAREGRIMMEQQALENLINELAKCRV